MIQNDERPCSDYKTLLEGAISEFSKKSLRGKNNYKYSTSIAVKERPKHEDAYATKNHINFIMNLAIRKFNLVRPFSSTKNKKWHVLSMYMLIHRYICPNADELDLLVGQDYKSHLRSFKERLAVKQEPYWSTFRNLETEYLEIMEELKNEHRK